MENIIKETKICNKTIEKKCVICKITEKEALNNNIELIKIGDMAKQKCDADFNNIFSSLISETEAYICNDCIELTNRTIEKLLIPNNKTLDEINEDSGSFTDYIYAGINLLRLDYRVIVPSCLNVLTTELDSLSKIDPNSTKNIIKTIMINFERELMILENIPNKSNNKDKFYDQN